MNAMTSTALAFLTLTFVGQTQGTTPPVSPQVSPIQLPAELPLASPAERSLPSIEITAEDAARIAVERNPRLRASRATTTLARGRTIESKSAMRPTVVATGSATNVDNLLGQSSTTSNTSTGGAGFATSVTLRQLIFDFGHTLASVRQAEANEKASRYAVTRAEQDIAFQAKQAFYALQLNEGLVKVQLANVTDRQSQFDLASARLKQGQGAPSDVLRAQTNVSSAVVQLIQARSTAQNSRIALAIAMGIDPRTPITSPGSSEAELKDDLPALLNQAQKSRPDLLQTLQQLRSAGFEIQVADSLTSPAVSLSMGFNSRGPNDINTNRSTTVGLTVTWGLWDGGLAQGKKLEAKASLEAAQANLDTLQQTIVGEVAAAWSTLRYAEQRLPSAEIEVKNAEESLRIARGRFEAGIANFLEVTDAETALVAARQNVVTAQAAVMLARAALRHSVGN